MRENKSDMIFLRRIQETDLRERVRWMNVDSIYPSMGFTPPISLENTMEWYHLNKNNNKRVDCSFVNERNELLAMAGLTNIDYVVRKAELYLFVNPDMQRQGIGHKSAYLLCKYAFKILQLNKVYLYTNASNLGAQKTYERVGFVLEGIMRAEKIIDGQYEDRLYYGLLASEFDHEYMPMIIADSSTLIEK